MSDQNAVAIAPVTAEPVLLPLAAAAQPVRPPVLHQTHTHGPHGLLPAIQSLLYIIVVALFIISFSVQPFRIPSPSMEPTLLVGDFVLVNKQLGSAIAPVAPVTFHRGDVVVFHFPVDPSLPRQAHHRPPR